MRGIPGTPSDELGKPVDSAQLQSMLTDGTNRQRTRQVVAGILGGQVSRLVSLDGYLAHGRAFAWRRRLRETGVRNPGEPLSPIILLGLCSLFGQLLICRITGEVVGWISKSKSVMGSEGRLFRLPVVQLA